MYLLLKKHCMKSVIIFYNQAHTERVEYILDKLEIRGYTRWQDVQGRGSIEGDPHLNTHTWPEQNSATLTVIDDHKVEPLLAKLKQLDEINTEVGIRAFVWHIEQAL